MRYEKWKIFFEAKGETGMKFLINGRHRNSDAPSALIYGRDSGGGARTGTGTLAGIRGLNHPAEDRCRYTRLRESQTAGFRLSLFPWLRIRYGCIPRPLARTTGARAPGR